MRRLPSAQILLVLPFLVLASPGAQAQSASGASVSLDSRTFTNEQVRLRLKDACVYERARTAEKYPKLTPSCRCYSEKLIAAMTPEEIDAWKATRTLSESAKAKAAAAADACPI